MYLEKGYRFTRKVLVDRILRTYLDVDSIAVSDWNYKSKIIDWGQRNRRKITFEVVRSSMQSGNARREYECRVNIDGQPQQSAIEFSIKAAEQLAAEKTYKELLANGTIVENPENKQ
jgi:ribonuclease-3